MSIDGVARLGGICGLLFVLLMVPAYAVGYPDAPVSSSNAREALVYFGASPGNFVLFNGVFAVFSTFFFLWFLGALHGVLRRAEGEGGGLSSAALAGGTAFIVLSCAGYATELLAPATLVRFDNYVPEAQGIFESLVLSSWLYHFCQVGAAVMVSATSLVVLTTGIMPRWLALVGLVAALLTLLHFLLPLIGAVAGLVWVALISALMLAGGPGASSSASSPRRHSRPRGRSQGERLSE
ncbi:MAG: hypothetical protein ACRDTR_08470 [Rubrobacter sp.]